MADIAATDVVYSLSVKDIVGGNKKRVVASLVFGDGVLTYPAGGVPVTKGKLGLPNVVESLVFVDPASANGFVYKYDLANNKVRIYQGDNDAVADGPLVELVAATATPAAATLKVEAVGW